MKKGDLLAQIDPRTFQAAYDQAAAKQQQDEALLATAQSTLKRNQALVAKGYVAAAGHGHLPQQRRQLRPPWSRPTRPRCAPAKVQLDYTKIISPIEAWPASATWIRATW